MAPGSECSDCDMPWHGFSRQQLLCITFHPATFQVGSEGHIHLNALRLQQAAGAFGFAKALCGQVDLRQRQMPHGRVEWNTWNEWSVSPSFPPCKISHVASTHPVNLLSTFHWDSPCREKIRVACGFAMARGTAERGSGGAKTCRCCLFRLGPSQRAMGFSGSPTGLTSPKFYNK